ncbi:ribonuclease III family protein [Metamycoplasma canadense]|uniref:Ribonuclease 3 n=1 Tax=Metamycoplasma canadense TaxID=29554 RepID=A0A077L5W7_9BACT|nr:ribonuclease III domain-containing protein [Metamycoplasma canadense]BAP39392.1 ribonuclease III [Metamycoplasma canadense]
MKLNKKELLFFDSLKNVLFKFKDIKIDNLNNEQKYILITAFTHKSYSNEHKNIQDNDFLEFVGDGVLQYILTKWILEQNINISPGEATKLRSKIVGRENLSRVAEKWKLFEGLRYSKSAFLNGINNKTISNLYEAFIGAIYQIYGIVIAEKISKQTLGFTFNNEIDKNHNHPKNALQEFFQKSSNSNVEYETVQFNNGTFGSTVLFENQIYGEGMGRTKKEAEKHAAINALMKLNKG